MRHLLTLTAMLVAAVALAAQPRTVTLQVKNMTCGTCPIVVRRALERVPGVSAASINFDKKTATVTFDPDRVKPSALTEATTNAGFPSSLAPAS
jgi:periplasmic mercuric ion binding protein